MLVVVSPAKKLNFEHCAPTADFTTPDFLDKSCSLIKELKKLSRDDIAKVMKLSDPLADLNFLRFQNFKTPFNTKNAKQAAYAFSGDTYVGLNFESFNKAEVTYAQKNLRILSGLYGILRPLDLIQPYRLEMGTRLKLLGQRNLYGVWQEDITASINNEIKKTIHKEKVLINCASKEYFSAVNEKALNCKVITPVFMEKKNGTYKVISFNAKRARGMMSQYILKNKISKVEDIKSFTMDNYKFNAKLSEANDFVFTR